MTSGHHGKNVKKKDRLALLFPFASRVTGDPLDTVPIGVVNRYFAYSRFVWLFSFAWFVNLGGGAKVDFTRIDHRFTQGGMWMYRLGQVPYFTAPSRSRQRLRRSFHPHRAPPGHIPTSDWCRVQ